MSNLQYQIYQQSELLFCRTLRLKIAANADAFNKTIMDDSPLTGITVDLNNPRTWKYYLNLSGQYHSTDTPMTIVSLDTLQTISFDSVTLTQHRATLREYYYGSTYYNELLSRYPGQEFLILGILNPVDIDTAIAAPDYSILYYDRTLIESNESNVVPELQEMIYTYIARWCIGDFRLTNNLYAVSVEGVLYALLPRMLRSIRLGNCKTQYAHSFHIWNYLDSHGYLSNYKEYLTQEQALWLYRNIKWVYANTGNKSTFSQVMDVVLTQRGIPLGAYNLNLDVEEIETTLSPAPQLLRTPLNLLGLVPPEPVVRTLDYVLEKEIPLARDNVKVFDASLRMAYSSFKLSVIPDLPTKVYESAMVDTSEQEPFLLADVLANEWLHLATNNRYSAVINVANPYTGDIMVMTMREAFTVWLYVYNRINYAELDVIPSVRALHVRKLTLPTIDQLRSVVESRLISDVEINAILDDQVPIGSIISTEAFYGVCVGIHAAMLRHRMYHTRLHHFEARAQMEAVVGRCYEDVFCNLTAPGETYLQFFANRGWTIEQLQLNDMELLIKDIVTKATGADTQNVKSIKAIQAALLRLMSQLGPYSSQYIQTINDSPLIPIDPIQVRLGDYNNSTKHHTELNDRLLVINSSQRQKHRDRINATDVITMGIRSDTVVNLCFDIGLEINVGTLPTTRYELPISSTYAELVGDLPTTIPADAVFGSI